MASSKKGAIFKFSLLSSSMLLTGVTTLSPILPNLQMEYPSISKELLQSFISLPNIAMMIAALVAGIVSVKIGKRYLLLIGVACVTFGGLLPMFLHSYVAILLVRLLLGIGIGFIQSIAASLIADFFDGKERNTMMGFQSASVGLGSTILTSLAGAIILINWRYTYLVYIIGIIVFLLSFFNIPNPPKEENTQAAKTKVKLPSSVIVVTILMLFFSIGYNVLFIDLSLTVVENKLGTAATSAAMLTVYSIASLIAGIVFGFIYGAMKKKTGAVALVLLACAALLVAFAPNAGLIYPAMVLAGFGFGWFMPFAVTSANEKTTTENSAMATALVFTANGLGAFVATYFYGFIGNLFGNSSGKFAFFVAGILMLIFCVITAVYFGEAKSDRQTDNS